MNVIHNNIHFTDRSNIKVGHFFKIPFDPTLRLATGETSHYSFCERPSAGVLGLPYRVIPTQATIIEHSNTNNVSFREAHCSHTRTTFFRETDTLEIKQSVEDANNYISLTAQQLELLLPVLVTILHEIRNQ